MDNVVNGLVFGFVCLRPKGGNKAGDTDKQSTKMCVVLRVTNFDNSVTKAR